MTDGEPPNDSTIIPVIGAGVLGLTTANLLQSRFPHNKKIAIIAAELPEDGQPLLSADYASAWAGAHYRPIPGSTAQLKDEAQLGSRTFEVMKKIAKEEPEIGVALLLGVEYLDSPPEACLALKTGDEYAGRDDGFRVLSKEELPDGSKWGCVYQTYCVNVPVYCRHLLSKFIKNGGRVIKRKLKTPGDVFHLAELVELGKASIAVNCSGRNFDTDLSVKIIRGQTCLVRNQYSKTVTRQYKDGRWATLIPRPLNGGTIVGVSKEVGDWEADARLATRRKLLQQSVETFPDFVKSEEDFQVISDNVGRRPFREGGLRLEVEASDDGAKCLVHGYGAGGRGYELSWAIGERLVELVVECEQAKTKVHVEAGPTGTRS